MIRFLTFALVASGIATSFARPVVELRDASLAELHAKASAGEAIRIVTLGGSITQKTTGHSAKIPAWFREQYPGAEVHEVNVGFGSTCSHSGAFRMEQHVLSEAPVDLLVAEFAVNDDQDAGHTYKAAVRGMEGIICRARLEGIPVLMVLYANEHLLAQAQKGELSVSQKAHLAVANHYGVPTVDVSVALAEATEAGTFDWKQYGGVHPNDAGYNFAVSFMTTALDGLLKADLVEVEIPEPLDPFSYFDGSRVAPSEATFTGDWAHGHPTKELIPVGQIRGEYATDPLARATKPGASLTYTFTGNAIGGFVLAGPDSGEVIVKIDDGEPTTVQVKHDKFSRGLNYPRTVIFADSLEAGEHTLHLEIPGTSNAGGTGNALNLLYLSVNQ